MSDDDIATNPVNSVGEFQDDLPLNNSDRRFQEVEINSYSY